MLGSDVERITVGGRRHCRSAAENLRIGEETLDERASLPVVARRNGVAPNLPSRRRSLMLEGGGVAVSGGKVTSNDLIRQMEERIRALARQLGRKMLKVEILEEPLDKVRFKTPP